MSPFGRFVDSGFIAGRMLSMGVPAITKMDVAPVSAMECDGGTINVTLWGMADAAIAACREIDAHAVTSSISLIVMGSKAYDKSYLLL